MITVEIVLDKRSVKKDGTSPLKLRLLYNRKSNQLSLGYSIAAKDWDAKRERVNPSCKAVDNINRINAILLKKKQRAFDVLSGLDIEGKLSDMSFREVKAYICSSASCVLSIGYRCWMVTPFYDLFYIYLIFSARTIAVVSCRYFNKK